MFLKYSRININTRKYWEKRYSANNYQIPEVYKTLYRQAARKIAAGSFVLDVGCGEGTFMQMLMEEFNIKSFGVDFASAAVELLKKKHLEGKVAPATDLPFEDGTFDAVTSLELLEHLSLKDCKNVLLEMKRVCKDNGLIVITVPTINFLTPQNEDEHMRAYSKNDIVRFLSLFIAKVDSEISENGMHWVASGYKYK